MKDSKPEEARPSIVGWNPCFHRIKTHFNPLLLAIYYYFLKSNGCSCAINRERRLNFAPKTFRFMNILNLQNIFNDMSCFLCFYLQRC